MARLAVALLVVAGGVLGCAGTDRAARPSSQDPKEAAVLAFAERRLQERYPEAYRRHAPYVAERGRHTDVWEVRPASGSVPGSPRMRVAESGDGFQIVAIDIEK